IRSTKYETNSKPESGRMTETEGPAVSVIACFCLIRICLGFRISDFEFPLRLGCVSATMTSNRRGGEVMTLSLTCTCGARLEIDDKFAGQPINCPDCQRALQAPAAKEATGRRTSGLALASILLALIGAFTVVGTLAAVVLGVLALLQIAGKPDRLAGKGYALAGILLGVL